MATDLGAGIYAYLAAKNGIVSAVDDDLYRAGAVPPDAELPRIVFRVMGPDPDYHMGGETGLANARVQFDCWAENETEATEAAEALRAELSGLQDATMGSVSVRAVFCDGHNPVHDLNLDGTEGTLTRVSADYIFWYTVD